MKKQSAPSVNLPQLEVKSQVNIFGNGLIWLLTAVAVILSL